MSGNKRDGDGFYDVQWKRAKTEITEDQTLFGFMREPPSLQSIATISVAIRLWVQPYVLKQLHDILQRYSYVADDYYNTIEKGVKRKLDEMAFPNYLKANIFNLIRPIGLQLKLCFIKSDEDYSYLYTLYKDMGLICWTMFGTIDNCKSLKTLIHNRNRLNNEIDLFRLACNYCLEDCINDLWAKMSSDIKNLYEDSENYLISYWISSLRNQLSQYSRNIKLPDNEWVYELNIYDLDCSVYQNIVSLSIHKGNVYSLKYFWCKLTDEEKLNNLKKWSQLAILASGMAEYFYYWYGRGNDYIKVLCFLLPHWRDQNDMKEIFHKGSGDFLKSLFLSWPQNQFFLKTLYVMMVFDYLHVDEYGEVMEWVIENIKEHKIEGEMFRAVWFSSSLKFKNSLIKHITKWAGTSYIIYMIKHWDAEVFHEILEFSSPVQKKDIILKIIGNIKKDNYSEIMNIVDVFVPKGLSTNREINLLKIGILLNSKFVRIVISYAGVQAAKQLISLCFPALNTIQKKEIDVKTIYKALVIVGDKDYTDQFLKWYFEEEDEIREFKKHFFDCPLSKWFPKGDWRLKKIIPDCGERWKVYERLIHDSFCSPEEIAQFKKEHLGDMTNLVREGDYEFALMFLNWFFISSDEVEVSKVDVGQLHKALAILGNFDYLDQLLKFYFKTVDAVEQFKKSKLNCPLNRWFSEWNLKLFVPDCGERWKIYERLIHDSFCAPAEILLFKKNHLSDLISLVQDRDLEFALIFLNWFFISSDEVEVDEADVDQLYEALAILGNFDYLDQFLKLYFRTVDAIQLFKKSKLNCPLNQWFSEWNLEYLIPKCDERWKLFENFINYNCRSPDEIAQFKEKQVGNAVNFVEKGDSRLSSMFINWCFDTEEAVHRYKLNYLTSRDYIAYLCLLMSPSSEEIKKVKDLIKWFSPTPTELERLKNLLNVQSALPPKFEHQRRKALIYLLDCFVRKCDSDRYSCNFGYDGVVRDILYESLDM